jgi:subtilisin
MSKKYLVTYKKSKMDLKGALSILELDEVEFERGADLLAVGRLGKNTPVHLENIGITIVCLEDRDVKRLLANSEILAIEEDSEVTIQGNEPNKSVEDLLNNNRLNNINHQETNHVKTTPVPVWNVQKVKAPEPWALGIDGSGINVAILGTGIAAHPDLVIAGGESFRTESSSESETTPVYKDEHGHGTHCAINSAGRRGYDGVAPNCNLYAVKVLNKTGSGRWSEVLAGMNWCIQNKMQVASIELVGKNKPNFATTTAITNCQNSGLTVVIATDNASETSPSWLCFSANSLIMDIDNASPSNIS